MNLCETQKEYLRPTEASWLRGRRFWHSSGRQRALTYPIMRSEKLPSVILGSDSTLQTSSI